MKITKQTDTATARKQIGKRVVFFNSQIMRHIEGIFIGFWNPEFTDANSQTTPPRYPVKFPFNVLTAGGVRIAVDSFTIVNYQLRF